MIEINDKDSNNINSQRSFDLNEFNLIFNYFNVRCC